MSRGGAAVRRVRRIVAGASLCVALALTVAPPAGATDGEHTSGPAAACLARIDRRVKDLGKLTSKVQSANDVTPAHRSALTTALDDAKRGLVALRAEVVALATPIPTSTPVLTPQHEDGSGGTIDPTAASPELAAACERVFEDFRVYALRKPQVHLVLAADRVTGQRALYSLLGSELEAAIAASPDDPDVPEARRLLDEFRAKIAAADLGASGVADAVIGFDPADWNADPSLLRPYAEVMKQVKQDLRTAKKDARQIVVLLGGAANDGAKTSGKA